jgi:hypothetical protein
MTPSITACPPTAWGAAKVKSPRKFKQLPSGDENPESVELLISQQVKLRTPEPIVKSAE